MYVHMYVNLGPPPRVIAVFIATAENYQGRNEKTPNAREISASAFRRNCEGMGGNKRGFHKGCMYTSTCDLNELRYINPLSDRDDIITSPFPRTPL